MAVRPPCGFASSIWVTTSVMTSISAAPRSWRSCAGNSASRRRTAAATPMVWAVANTAMPKSAARTAASTVSRSLASPTTTAAGRRRRLALNPSAKLGKCLGISDEDISAPSPPMPSKTNSMGAS